MGKKRSGSILIIFSATFIGIVMLLFILIMEGGCVTKTNKKGDDIKNISFAHDGKKILFSRKNDESPDRIHVYDLETGELSVYQQPSGELWTNARYSNDGKKIVFVIIPKKDKALDLANMQIAVMDTDGRNIRRITNSPGTRIYPSFSHSGEKIIFARADRIRESGKTLAADYDVFEVDVKTGKETRLTWFKFFLISPPYYFPDDKTFIFAAESPFSFPGIPDSDRDAIKRKREELKSKYIENNIYVMHGGEQTLEPYIVYGDMTRQYGEGAKKPLITSDGSRIFFLAQAYKPDGSGDWDQYFEYSPDGRHRRITNLKAIMSIGSAAVSSDGKLLGIVYEGRENYPASGKRRIIIYNVKDGTSREISLPAQPSRIIN